jgi:transcriptional regulator with XRE-family HTH domain
LVFVRGLLGQKNQSSAVILYSSLHISQWILVVYCYHFLVTIGHMDKPNLRTQLAQRLREWMDARPDLNTQAKVAKISGVAQTTISRILNAGTGVTLDNLEAIARAFDRHPYEMLIDSDTQLAQQIAHLPVIQQQHVAAFAQFVANQQQIRGGSNENQILFYTDESAPTPELQPRLRQAAMRQPKKVLLNHDVPTQNRETSRRAKVRNRKS